MTIRTKTPTRQRVIDLDGPQGNAFALMGIARDTARQLGWDKEKQDNLMAEMMSGDYENLLTVFDLNFGSIYTLERSVYDEAEDY